MSLKGHSGSTARRAVHYCRPAAFAVKYISTGGPRISVTINRPGDGFSVKRIFVSSALFILVTACAHQAVPNDTSVIGGYDFDGDGIPDRLLYAYTGGGHCCYHIGFYLSAAHTTAWFPFDIDGGYGGGLDNSQPDRFLIADLDNDGRAEVFAQINTYNGKLMDLPFVWQAEYGIHTHTVIFDYADGTLTVKDKWND